jgi:hypothetical protein
MRSLGTHCVHSITNSLSRISYSNPTIRDRPGASPLESVLKKMWTTVYAASCSCVPQSPEGTPQRSPPFLTVGAHDAIIRSPGGAAQLGAQCRPAGAWFSALTPTHGSRRGLRSFVPDGTGHIDMKDSSFCGTDSQPSFLAMFGEDLFLSGTPKKLFPDWVTALYSPHFN